MKLTFAAVLITLSLGLAGCERELSPRDSAQVTVFAAVSASDVMREAGKRFEAQKGIKVVCSFDSSSALAQQIKAGSPADVFLSADQKWMDDVAAAGVIRKESRQDLLGNTLVLIAPADRKFEAQVSKEFDFVTQLPEVERIAVGDPAHVPAGRYARQALERIGWWRPLEARMVTTNDVRAAVRLVEIGEADAGIVYATDARQSDKVAVVAAIPIEFHDPIRYPIALCNDSQSAADFIQFLRSAEMIAVFEQAGFEVISATEER